MAGGKKKTKTTAQQPYSKEEVLNAIFELDSDSCDTVSSSSSEELNETQRKNGHTMEFTSTDSSPKTYVDLQNIKLSSTSSDFTPFSSSVHLEFSSSGGTPPSSSPESTSTYGKYSSTESTSNTGSLNSSPTFHSDNSTESNPTPCFPEDLSKPCDIHNDSDSGSSLADFDVEDIQIPKSETVLKKRAVLQLNEIPFSVLMQWIRSYLISIDIHPNKPDYPVPDMDKNQKRNFRRTTEKFKIVNGHLKHLHVYVDEKNKVKRGECFNDSQKLIPEIIIYYLHLPLYSFTISLTSLFNSRNMGQSDYRQEETAAKN